MLRRPIAVLAAVIAAAVPFAVQPIEVQAKAFGKRTLKKPMRGSDVRHLQRLLTRVGIKTTVDGHFGRQTVVRVRRWERSGGRRVDGRVSRADAIALRNAVVARERNAQTEPNNLNTGSGGASPDAQTPAQPVAPTAPGERAQLRNGLAIAPASAPQQVKDIIDAGNEIAKTPYKWGGGHAKLVDSGYDCSGSMSYALRAAGLVDTSLTSTGFMSWGKAGEGKWITSYAHANHSYMIVAGLRFDTSGLKQTGSRWQTAKRSSAGFTVRSYEGL